MEEQQTPQTNPPQGSGIFNTSRQDLPNATAVLVLGILSIVLSCWYFSIIGVVLSIIALVLSSKDLTVYYSNPNQFTASSFNNIKAGRVCAIIGLTIAIIFFIFMILILVGVFVSMPFWGMID
jgi:magnesium-transporting ATPase (P-type)